MARHPLIARLATLLILMGVLVQSALGLPLSLRMATPPGLSQVAEICGQVHRHSEAPALPAHDHEHCMLCQGGTLPPLLPATLAYAAPILVPAPVFAPIGTPTIPPRTPRAFASRAPPTLV
ncbi:DUF2946 family protein [Acidisphaera sp. L21]|uniref:DUF2946 family protein n=1 Tax=Acidisphaera sp. L21 TaxID=1641851 RepID=UPI00131C5156|nr:DUF2946 family protein [Acidisphaera sp. L21]